MTVHPRRAREIARTRQDILEAAARAFANNGYQAVTMQEIAREAGYTAASLYSYFSSKEEILEGLRDLVRAEMDAIFEQPIPSGIPLREKLHLLFQRQLEATRKRLELVVLIHMGMGGHEASCEMHSRRLESFAKFLETHAKPEELGGHSPESVALMINGIGAAYFMQSLFLKEEGWLEKNFPAALDVLLAGLRKGG